MGLLQHIIDLGLALTLLGLAWAVLFSRDHFRAVVLFIALGLVMALVWVRLAAPEVALAEAAIGAGISGALLLSALKKLGTEEKLEKSGSDTNFFINRANFLPLVFCLILLLPAAWLLWQVPAAAPGSGAGAGATATALLPDSGVSNRVTAVLLNFRAFDTLLELVILLLAVIGVWSLGRHPRPPSLAPAGPVLLTLVRGVMPLAILIAGYLVWIGDQAPGGAFQGGAVLGAAGIMLALAYRPLTVIQPRPPLWLLRAVLVAGLVVFLLIAALPLAGEALFLQYPPRLAGALILTIEAAAALSIGLALCLLYEGGAPVGQGEPP